MQVKKGAASSAFACKQKAGAPEDSSAKGQGWAGIKWPAGPGTSLFAPLELPMQNGFTGEWAHFRLSDFALL